MSSQLGYRLLTAGLPSSLLFLADAQSTGPQGVHLSVTGDISEMVVTWLTKGARSRSFCVFAPFRSAAD